VSDEDDNLSLLSYQESERHDDKYYDADELIKIIGSQIETKTKNLNEIQKP
jgi:hypothetical protein